MKSFLPNTELALVPTIEVLARKGIANGGGEVEPDMDLVKYWGECTRENLSEGSGQTAKGDECSCRAFTNLFRIKRPDLIRVRESAGNFRGRSFNEFAYSQILMQVLSGSRLFAEVLARIVSKDKPKGPIHPNRRYLELMPALPALAEEAAGAPVPAKDQLKVYVAHVLTQLEAPHYMNAGLTQFAGLIRVAPADLKKVVAAVKKHKQVVSWVQQEAVAEIIVNALRVTSKYQTGVKWSQFNADNDPIPSSDEAPSAE